MALSPTSSHGGGTFNGGTITQPLVLAMASDTDVALSIVPPSTIAGSVELYKMRDKTGSVISHLTARGDFLLDGTQQNADIEIDGGGGGTIGLHNSLSPPDGTQIFGLRAPNGIKTTVITDSALPTVAPVSGTPFQCSTSRDVCLVIPFTGDATNNVATLKIELSPDNVTYSTLDTLSIAAALNLTGALNAPVTLNVPVAWYVKLTATHGTIGTSTYY